MKFKKILTTKFENKKVNVFEAIINDEAKILAQKNEKEKNLYGYRLLINWKDFNFNNETFELPFELTEEQIKKIPEFTKELKKLYQKYFKKEN
jgi:RecG-like helicase